MKKILLLCLLVGLTSFSASAQYFQWAKIQNNTMNGNCLASGNSIIATTGTFFQTMTIGNQTFTSTDSLNAYLAVHDHSGNLLWAKHIIGKSFNMPRVAVDANQNIIISGAFVDSLYIDGLIYKTPVRHQAGLFIAKFSPTGTLLWAQKSDLTSNAYDLPHEISVALDGSGNIFLAGDFANSISFNGTNLSASTSRDGFIVKYNSNGVFQWAVNPPNNTYEAKVLIKATTAGEIYLVELAHGTGGPSTTNQTLSKFNTSGTLLWSKNFNHPNSNTIPNLTIDNLNNAYITATHNVNITIGNTTLIPDQTSVFMAKVDAAGNWKWARSVASKLTSGLTNSFVFAPSIFYTPTNEIAIAGTFGGTALFNGTSITSSQTNNVSNTNTFIAKLDTAGNTIWVNNVSGSGGNRHSDLTGDIHGNLFTAGYFLAGNVQFGNTTLNATSWLATYLTKVNNGNNAVSGTIFIDSNSNGIKDASETGYGGVMLEKTPGPIYGISASDGTYKIYLSTGNSTISLPNPPPSYTLVPASQSVSFSGSNQTQSGKDFALQPIPNSNDVKVTVTEFIPARPGFNAKYRLTFHNSGTTVLSDTLKFSHNTSTLTFVSSSVAPLSNNNGEITWKYLNLQPNETRNIDVTFSVPNTTSLGTPLQAIASIKPYTIDLYQADNYDTLNHVVVGSFDPNDKQVDKITLSLNQAANGEYLDYTIRFQNTGTDTAFTVVVTDRISTKLNLSDFEMLSASHNYKLNVVDGNMLEWRFDNILLPDSNRNEPASHGFVRFRIKSKAGLVLGDSITNNAAIYFDYNAPVITNYAVTKVANPTGIKENKAANIQAFRLYPNPAKNYVMIEAEFKKNTPATVSLVNLLGQTISTVNLPVNNQIHYQMPLNELPKGVYLIRLQTETGMQTQRLVIQ